MNGAARRRDAGEPARPRALEQPHQDRLRLIVGACGRWRCGADTSGQRARLERGIARVARLRLQSVPRRLATNGHALEVERQPEPLAETADEVGVGIGLGAQTVMHVSAREGEAERGRQLPEHVEERDGVGAAGDGSEDGFAADDQPVAVDRGEDLRREAVGRGRRRPGQRDSRISTIAC